MIGSFIVRIMSIVLSKASSFPSCAICCFSIGWFRSRFSPDPLHSPCTHPVSIAITSGIGCVVASHGRQTDGLSIAVFAWVDKAIPAIHPSSDDSGGGTGPMVGANPPCHVLVIDVVDAAKQVRRPVRFGR